MYTHTYTYIYIYAAKLPPFGSRRTTWREGIYAKVFFEVVLTLLDNPFKVVNYPLYVVHCSILNNRLLLNSSLQAIDYFTYKKSVYMRRAPSVA